MLTWLWHVNTYCSQHFPQIWQHWQDPVMAAATSRAARSTACCCWNRRQRYGHCPPCSVQTRHRSDTHAQLTHKHLQNGSSWWQEGDNRRQEKGLASALPCGIVTDVPDSPWLARKCNLMSSVNTFLECCSLKGVYSSLADGLCLFGWLVTHGCHIRGHLGMPSMTANRCCTQRRL